MSKVLPYVAPQLVPITVAINQGVSSTVDLGNNTLVGLFTSATLTSTTVTFQAALTAGGTYVNVQDGAGATITKTVAGGQYIYLDPNVFAGIRFLQLTFGSNEGAARTMNLVVRPIT